MDEYIYYIRDNYNRPMVTVCLIRDENNRYARGVAICSLKETGPDKKVGRMYARGRALRAFKKATVGEQEKWSLVNREEAYRSLLKANRPILPMEFFEAKSIYSPKLNNIEEQFIAKKALRNLNNGLRKHA